MSNVIKGKIIVIKNKQDYYNIEEDVILVAENTHPDLVIAINKIQAIVTEIDNNLCHAAIVAREFDKPLLMGINKATKRFKTGDMVEINFDNKIINKIG